MEDADAEASLLQAKVALTVDKACKKTADDQLNKVKISRGAVQTIAKVVMEVAGVVAEDLFMFATHAKRTAISSDDVKLCARKSPSLLKALEKYETEELGVTQESRKAKSSTIDKENKAAKKKKSTTQQQLEASRPVKTGRMKMRALEFLRYIPMDNEAEILASAGNTADPAAGEVGTSRGQTSTANPTTTNSAKALTAVDNADASPDDAAVLALSGSKVGENEQANIDGASTSKDRKSGAASGAGASLQETDQAAAILANALGGGTTIEAGPDAAAGGNASLQTAETQANAAGADKTTNNAAAPMGIYVRGPADFTYASEREWLKRGGHRRSREAREKALIHAGIHDDARLFLSWDKGYPGMVLSVIKYSETAESRRGKMTRLGAVMMDVPRRRQEVPKILSDASWLQREGTSYARYFNKEWAEVSGDRVDPARAAREEAWDREYHPMALDDPHMRLGKHRIVQGLDGYYLSVLPYTKKKVLKQELNEVFREKHPELPAELTLSKIRNLKREVLEHARTLNLELSTAALAIVYFEKLVFKGVVDKRNRKLVMSVCLLLAYKLNEPKLPETATVADLLEDIERVQALAPRQVLEAEFNVFGHLLFHLNASKEHVLTHFSRLLKTIETTPTEYLGEDLAQFYFPKLGDDDVSDDESVSHAPPPPPTESSRADQLPGILVPLPVPVPKPQRHTAPVRARKAAKALVNRFGMPGGGMMQMLSKMSGRVLNELTAGEDDLLANFSGKRVRSICPVSEDGRLVVTGFLGDDPAVKIPNTAKALARVRLADLHAQIAHRHGPGTSMTIWNLSGERYEYGDAEVIEHNFGIHPAPPLATLQRLVREITACLRDDARQVAIIHDLSGRRSAVVAACCLLALEEDLSAQEALAKIGNALGGPGQALVPSQIRYIEYFSQLSVDNKECTLGCPQRLERIIVNGIPDYVNASGSGPQVPVKCRPFAKVILGTETVAGTRPGPIFTPEDLCFSLVPLVPGKKSSAPAGVVVRGDVLVRVYHADEQTQRTTPMFALAFHTGFVQDGVLRAQAVEIDGAKDNGRFPPSFFVDLIFTPLPHLAENEDGLEGDVNTTNSFENKSIAANGRRRRDKDRADIRIDDDADEAAGVKRSSGNDDNDALVKELRKYNTSDLTSALSQTREATRPASSNAVTDATESLEEIEKLVDDLDLDALDMDDEDGIGQVTGTNGEMQDAVDDDIEDFDVDAFASSLDLDLNED
ncbi:CDK5 and ABL1 enzyme substrate 1 [Hondaea fermentalgiana]|uniref:CDK5 and ABL1 enzyme substrate 1 n=1 Tax=Hondaea fermentalgiana TaxID=2315210 RepID=A0A2R5GJQ3_9STRA|nr:CDK5 and ABL1 enzyme substrate 1 [Hondaea fermentalgiana]|eukprot:GBG30855.1 CDK5 and ABL1 enzyme substrate 1 [Hondaea fermentalgiana]